ncbi:MAG: flavin reductase family protein [Pirellulales bacterium]|nr:flavin reductase family protein [Pirellulales bacterium]
MSSAELRDLAQSIFATLDPEVWVITAGAGGRRGGLVATWVKPASIDPNAPALVVAIDESHFTGELIAASGSFGAHLLPADQHELAWRFAIGSGRDRDKLAGLDLKEAEVPILADCAAWLECRVYESKTTGDRTYYWADVSAAARPSDGPILRQSEMMRKANPASLEELRASKETDIAVQRPLREMYRRDLR